MSGETETIARILARGFNEHIRLHGPDGDYAGEAVETGDGHGIVVTRQGAAYGVRVERLQVLGAPGPLTPGQCWAALKDHLTRQLEPDLAATAGSSNPAAPAPGSGAGEYRAVLAKMLELEAG